MNNGLRSGTIAGAVGAMLCACALAACTTQEADGPTGGTGGNGGNIPSNGGAGGSGTPTTSAGNEGTLCPPAQRVITDFTYTSSDGGTSTTEVRFGGNGTLTGGQAYYPNSGSYPLTVDVTQSSYHVSGRVGDYSGFALYFDNCDRIDASAFKGIRFTISGTVPGNAISFAVGTLADKTTAAWLIANGSTTAKATDSGKCTPSSNTNNEYYHPGCADPTAQIAVTATPTVVDVPWANLVGGSPQASVTPKELTGMSWILPWTEGRAPYDVDIVIDDLGFMP